jgi:hypothetical protein
MSMNGAINQYAKDRFCYPMTFSYESNKQFKAETELSWLYCYLPPLLCCLPEIEMSTSSCSNVMDLQEKKIIDRLSISKSIFNSPDMQQRY